MSDRSPFLLIPILGITLYFAYLANQGQYLALLPDQPGVKTGLLIAIAFSLGLLAIEFLPTRKWLATSILLAIFTPLALAGFWFSDGYLGISDWDYYFSYHTAVRKIVLEHGVFPEWNPYICGGTSGIGDPEFPLLTPTFLLELIFGIPIGFRLAIYLSTATLAIGMLMLGKELKLSRHGAVIAALITAFGSVNILEIVEGHPNVFSAMYIPWIILLWLKSYRNKSRATAKASQQQFLQRQANSPESSWGRWGGWLWKNSLLEMLLGIVLALTFFQGGIYLLMYTAFAFAFLILVSKRKIAALKTTVIAGLWALGFASIKLIPVFFWLQQFQDKAYASSANTLLNLHHILLGRFLHGSEVIPNQGSGWHEYGAYIGPIALTLALLAILTLWKHKLTRILTLAAVIALLTSASGPILKPFFDQAPWLPRSNISRVILFAIIPISLLAGMSTKKLGTVSRRTGSWQILIIILFVTADLFSLAYPLSQQAFVLPYPEHPISKPDISQPLLFNLDEHLFRHQETDYTRAYASLEKGYGTLSYCSVLGPEPAVRTIQHKEEDNSFAVSDQANIDLASWDPNKTILTASTGLPTDVILNQNYSAGWQVNGRPAKDIAGRVAANIQPGKTSLIFQYKASGFRLGLIISGLTSLLAIYLISTTKWRKFGHNSSAPPSASSR